MSKNIPFSVNKTTLKVVSSDEKDKLIEQVNLLRDTLAKSGYTKEISLPRIVVVGSQSAGKSSVLESIVGRLFLPRGTGVVTRRPTIVQLHKSDNEYVVFSHKPGEKFTDYTQVRDEIANETLRHPGPVGFSSTPIIVKIFLPNALKLTLVDLPGLIQIDEPKGSVEAVQSIILEHITPPDTLIVAISPANQDIETSESIAISKFVDTESERTIGVLTKLDLMDEGTDATTVLENVRLPLKKGYIGVVNRSQKDTDDVRDFDYSLQKEKNFFESMPCYKNLGNRLGTPNLKKILNEQLYTLVKESLPGVRQELSQKLGCLQKQYSDYLSDIGYILTNERGIQSYMMKLVHIFIDDMHIEIFGGSERVPMDRLTGGSKISYKLCMNVRNSLLLPKVPDKDELLKIIANLHGMRCSMSLPSLALESVANQLLMQYNDPLNTLVDDIAETLLSAVQYCCEMLNSYTNLKKKVQYFMRKSIREAALNTKECLEKDMKATKYFVNTYHQDFEFSVVKCDEKFFPLRLWDARNVSDSVPTSTSDTTGYNLEAIEVLSNDSAKQNAEYLAENINRYLIIQKKQVEDTAIKYIAFFLVKAVMDFLRNGLIISVLECEDKVSVFQDCEKDIEKMNGLKEACELLEEALNAVQSF